MAGWIGAGDTTNAGNDDDLPSAMFGDSSCWDAQTDVFYRVFLVAGDTLRVTLSPRTPSFDSMLMVYAGTSCAAGGDDPIACFNDGSDGKTDSIPGLAVATTGWHTVVVDGRMAFAEDEDFGPFDLRILVDAKGGACCP
jgi:hypothetical protein